MTTPSPDEMKAREIANALRVNASTTGADAEEELIAAITQALSEKTAEIEALDAKFDECNADYIREHARAEAAEARLSEVVEECAETVKAHVMHGLDDYARGFREAIAVAEAAIRARFQNGGKDNG